MRALRTSSCLMRTPILLIAALACTAMCGCGVSKPKPAPVSGQVLLGEAPVANAVVILHPVRADAKAIRPAGRTDEQGRFTLTTNKDGDGAPPGDYRVTITAYQSEVRKGDDSVIVNHLPEKYARPETSTLSVTVSKGNNEVGPFRLAAR